jgi:WD40 repeat protein
LFLATAGDDGVVRVWARNSSQQLATLSGHCGPVFACVFTPDSKTLISAGRDKVLRGR